MFIVSNSARGPSVGLRPGGTHHEMIVGVGIGRKTNRDDRRKETLGWARRRLEGPGG